MEVWELKLYFYPSAGGFKKKKKTGIYLPRRRHWAFDDLADVRKGLARQTNKGVSNEPRQGTSTEQKARTARLTDRDEEDYSPKHLFG